MHASNVTTTLRDISKVSENYPGLLIAAQAIWTYLLGVEKLSCGGRGFFDLKLSNEGILEKCQRTIPIPPWRVRYSASICEVSKDYPGLPKVKKLRVCVILKEYRKTIPQVSCSVQILHGYIFYIKYYAVS